MRVKTKKQAVIRTIYNNYNLWEDSKDDAIETLKANDITITDSAIWEEIYNQDEYDWIGIKDDLERFFNGESTWILQGTCECWDGNHKAGMIFEDFEEMLNKAAKDCDYIHLYDKNGHLYLKCSHHDGTNYYEIKKVTDRGVEYLANWKDNWDDNRTEQYVHNQIMERYSVLPHFGHKVYCYPKIEWKKEEKDVVEMEK